MELYLLNEFLGQVESLIDAKIRENKEESLYRFLYNGRGSDLARKMGIHVHDGATKFCFMRDDLDYVLKMGMQPTDRYRKFCQLECDYYEMAKEHDIAGFFAEAEKVDEYEGYLIYAQQKAEVYEDETDEKMYSYSRSKIDEEDFDDPDDYEDAVWDGVAEFDVEDQIHAVLGEGFFVNKLVEFCWENCINDLHNGNWGLIDGEYVLIDYSGYNWD